MRISSTASTPSVSTQRQDDLANDGTVDQRAKLPQANMNQFTGGNPLYQSGPTVITEDGSQYTTDDPNESVIVYADDVNLNVTETPGNPDAIVEIYANSRDSTINGSNGKEHVTLGGGSHNHVFTHGGDDKINVVSNSFAFVDAGAGRDEINVTGTGADKNGIRTVIGGADSDVITAKDISSVIMYGDNWGGVQLPEDGNNFEGQLNPVRDGDDTFNVENSEWLIMYGQNGNDTFNIDSDSRRWSVWGGGQVGAGSIDEEFVDTVNLDIAYDDSIVHEMQHLIRNQNPVPNQKLVIRDDQGYLGTVIEAERINYSNGVSFEFTGDDWVRV